ncbi:MAG: class I SAM-dependent RNA methyltransferase [Lachnospirales bacterium]
MDKYNFIATTTFGLESTVKRELQRLDITDIKTQDGRIDFTGSFSDMIKANINLRSADRILWNIGEGPVKTFEDLFQLVSAFEWSKFLPENANFHVNGKSVKSTLSSVPACQKIVEKAIVTKMQEKYNVDFFQKDGPLFKVQIAILKDMATITIDTSGSSLHKRGYRESQLSAPLKETLAHALIELSYWRKDRILLDPCCGSGTIPIEAALIAKNIAPGIKRKFVSEYWTFIDKELWTSARKEAREKENRDFVPEIYGYDIDEEAIEIAKENAIKAGVEDCITFKVQSMKDLQVDKEYGVVITNPPYGERIGEEKEVINLYRTFGDKFKNEKTWSFYCITSNEDFERLYGKKCDKKRKLYNGKIKIDYYQYNGERPPKKDKY